MRRALPLMFMSIFGLAAGCPETSETPSDTAVLEDTADTDSPDTATGDDVPGEDAPAPDDVAVETADDATDDTSTDAADAIAEDIADGTAEDVQPAAPTCAAYCTAITAACTGANAQFADNAACLAWCERPGIIALGNTGDTSGNTIGCRISLAEAASTNELTANLHCPNAGPSGGNVCVCRANCEDKQCGDNGCGGLCGVCDVLEACPAVGACVPLCGNGDVDQNEDCDGSAPNAPTCQSLGYEGGIITCGSNCLYDITDCSVCGDGMRQGDEGCDGIDFGTASCQSLGFASGNLACNLASCTLVVTGCRN
jgi:hypothetical protein